MSSSRNVSDKLKSLRKGLIRLANKVQKGREGLKKYLYRKLERLLEDERNDENLAEIDKDEAY